MNLCIVNEDHPPCNVPRKAIKACPGRGQPLLGSLWPSHPLSHLESGHAIPFSPQDFCSPCEFVHCCHNTWIPRAWIPSTYPWIFILQLIHMPDGAMDWLSLLTHSFCLFRTSASTWSLQPSVLFTFSSHYHVEMFFMFLSSKPQEKYLINTSCPF